MKYYVCINCNGFEVSGCEAAWAAFHSAAAFGDLVDVLVTLVDGETGEVIADNMDDE